MGGMGKAKQAAAPGFAFKKTSGLRANGCGGVQLQG